MSNICCTDYHHLKYRRAFNHKLFPVQLPNRSLLKKFKKEKLAHRQRSYQGQLTPRFTVRSCIIIITSVLCSERRLDVGELLSDIFEGGIALVHPSAAASLRNFSAVLLTSDTILARDMALSRFPGLQVTQ